MVQNVTPGPWKIGQRVQIGAIVLEVTSIQDSRTDLVSPATGWHYKWQYGELIATTVPDKDDD